MVEVTYTPIIQSKNTKTGYDLKPSAISSEDNMAVSGVILCSIGIKYKAYCAQIGRSFLVDPTKVEFHISLLPCSYSASAGTRPKLYLPAESSARTVIQDAWWGRGERRLCDSNRLYQSKETSIWEVLREDNRLWGVLVQTKYNFTYELKPSVSRWESSSATVPGYSTPRTLVHFVPIWSFRYQSVSRTLKTKPGKSKFIFLLHGCKFDCSWLDMLSVSQIRSRLPPIRQYA